MLTRSHLASRPGRWFPQRRGNYRRVIESNTDAAWGVNPLVVGSSPARRRTQRPWLEAVEARWHAISLVGEVDPNRHGSRLQRLYHLGSESSELAAACDDIVVRPECRDSGAPLIPLSHTDIRIVGDISAPTGAGAMLADHPRTVVVELSRHGDPAYLAGLAPDGLQLGGHGGAHPQSAQPLHRRVEQASDRTFSAELSQRLVFVGARHGYRG